MKKTNFTPTRLLLILIVLAFFLPLCSCAELDSTALMTEEQRADWLYDMGGKYFSEEKYHLEYEIKVTVSDGKESTSYNVAFDEFYDGTDPSNIKYIKNESRNDITGYVECCTFVDGIMYLSSDSRKIAADVKDADEMFSYQSYYSVYFEASIPVTISCPPLNNGKYVYTQNAIMPNKMTELYNNIRWAIPSQMYNSMKIDRYQDQTVYDSDGRFLEYSVTIEVCNPNQRNSGAVSIRYKEIAHYDDFTITAPENSGDYHRLSNYRATIDTVETIYNFLNEWSGSFDYSFDLSISGAVNYRCKEDTSVSYSISGDGIPNFSVYSVSNYTDSEADKVTVTECNGTTLVSASGGNRQETPVTPEEAYYTLNAYKDCFYFYDGAFDTFIEYPEVLGNRYKSVFTLKEEFIANILSNELYYFLGVEPDGNNIDASGDCSIYAIYTPMGYVADEISLSGTATLEINGESIEMVYTYKLTVNQHQN